jgi:hypothetical protein
LRKYVAERRAQTAAGRVDVALPALEAQLNGEIGFGARTECREAEHYEQTAWSKLRESANH